MVKILLANEEIQPIELDFFLRFPITPHVTSPVDFLSNQSWGGVRTLAQKDEFRYAKKKDKFEHRRIDKISSFLGILTEILKLLVKDGRNLLNRIVRKGKNYLKIGKTKLLCKGCV